MPDKKLTDVEIKKALECCGGIEHDCDKCPYEENNECGELNGILKDALDLINRLEAKCEELQGIIVKYNSNLAKQVAENEKLNIRLRKERYQFADIGKMYSEIKSEAYKEFAEEFKKQLENHKGMTADNGNLILHNAVISAIDFVCEALTKKGESSGN